MPPLAISAGPAELRLIDSSEMPADLRDTTISSPDVFARAFCGHASALREHPSRGLRKPSGRIGDRAGGIGGKHIALADQAIHRRCDHADVASCICVTLLQRESRIAARKRCAFVTANGI